MIRWRRGVGKKKIVEKWNNRKVASGGGHFAVGDTFRQICEQLFNDCKNIVLGHDQVFVAI
jgi:hypothetical protein